MKNPLLPTSSHQGRRIYVWHGRILYAGWGRTEERDFLSNLPFPSLRIRRGLNKVAVSENGLRAQRALLIFPRRRIQVRKSVDD